MGRGTKRRKSTIGQTDDERMGEEQHQKTKARNVTLPRIRACVRACVLLLLLQAGTAWRTKTHPKRPPPLPPLTGLGGQNCFRRTQEWWLLAKFFFSWVVAITTAMGVSFLVHEGRRRDVVVMFDAAFCCLVSFLSGSGCGQTPVSPRVVGRHGGRLLKADGVVLSGGGWRHFRSTSWCCIWTLSGLGSKDRFGLNRSRSRRATDGEGRGGEVTVVAAAVASPVARLMLSRGRMTPYFLSP